MSELGMTLFANGKRGVLRGQAGTSGLPASLNDLPNGGGDRVADSGRFRKIGFVLNELFANRCFLQFLD